MAGVTRWPGTDELMADEPRQNPTNGTGPEGDGTKNPAPPPPVKMGRGLMVWLSLLGALIMVFVLLNGSNRGKQGSGDASPSLNADAAK